VECGTNRLLHELMLQAFTDSVRPVGLGEDEDQQHHECMPTREGTYGATSSVINLIQLDLACFESSMIWNGASGL
jgi:hypothetical protein